MTDQENLNLIYGVHTCNAQLKLSPQNIKQIYLKKPPINNQISKISEGAKNLNIKIEVVEKDFLTTLCFSSKRSCYSLFDVLSLVAHFFFFLLTFSSSADKVCCLVYH